MGLHSEYKLLVVQTNIRLGWKWLRVTNTLAYDAETLATILEYLKYKHKIIHNFLFLG
jgi:hypothetical protein